MNEDRMIEELSSTLEDIETLDCDTYQVYEELRAIQQMERELGVTF